MYSMIKLNIIEVNTLSKLMELMLSEEGMQILD